VAKGTVQNRGKDVVIAISILLTKKNLKEVNPGLGASRTWSLDFLFGGIWHAKWRNTGPGGAGPVPQRLHHFFSRCRMNLCQ